MDIEDVIERFDEGLFSLLILGGTILGVAVVQWAVRRYRRVSLQVGNASSHCGLPGHIVASRLLAAIGLPNVNVGRGDRLNYYHPREREIRLTAEIHDSPTLSALAVAAHEVGHAQQFATPLWRCRLRNALVPTCYVLPLLGAAVVLLGTIGHFDWASGVTGTALAVVCIAPVVLLLPINLPLERDASRRAADLVRQAEMIGPDEQPAFDRLLDAAWLTHAAVEAQRWIMLAVVLIVVALAPTFFYSSDEQFAVVAEPPPQLAAPLDAEPQFDLYAASLTPLAWELALGVGPLLGAGLLLAMLQHAGRPGSSISERAVRLNNAASALNQQGDQQQAIRLLTEALQLDPSLMAAYFNRGAAHFSLSTFDEALADFESALRLSPRFADALVGRGNVRLLHGELDLARADFDEAVRLMPESATALVSRGNLWKATGNLDRAIADFEAALARDPQSADAYRDRGLAWYFKGDQQRAIADANAAIAINPQDALAFNNRGCALFKLGDYGQAAADLREAIRLAPDFPNPYKHLAWLQATCRDPAWRNGPQAVSNATRALELTHWQQRDWIETLSAAHAEAGNFDEAARLLATS